MDWTSRHTQPGAPFWSGGHARVPGAGRAMVYLPSPRYDPIVARFLQALRIICQDQGVTPDYYLDLPGRFTGLLRMVQHLSYQGVLSVSTPRAGVAFHNHFVAVLRRLQLEQPARNEFRIMLQYLTRPGVMDAHMRGLIQQYGDTVNPTPRPVRES